jgi:exo-beta-1,3-glucanase (GH17 family)
VIVVCPFTSPAPAPTSAATSDPASAAAPAKSAPTTTATASPNKIGNGSNQWGITYTAYTSDGQCKSSSDVLADITSIKNAGFDTVRVYSTDCDTLTSVGDACRAVGCKIILGIFIGEPGCDNGSPHVSDQVAAIKSWSQWDLVELLVVGNEAIFNGYCTIPQLAGLIASVRGELGGAGYSGPMTTTDVVSVWVGNDVSELCAAIDVVACNAHSYFNQDTAAEDAGTFVAGQLALVEQACNGKSGYVMETGWPHQGKCNNKSCPSTESQATAIIAIKNEIGEKAIFFSFSDDTWKGPSDCDCEQFFGCFSVW